MHSRPYQICNHCIMDTSDPQIIFDEQGHCDYCNNFETTIKPNWHPDQKGLDALKTLADKIKKENQLMH